jgi:hypothetical protein
MPHHLDSGEGFEHAFNVPAVFLQVRFPVSKVKHLQEVHVVVQRGEDSRAYFFAALSHE